jgi:integrase
VNSSLCNAFLNHKQARLDNREISPRTFENYRQTAELLVKQFGKTRLVADLRPDDFAALRNTMTKNWGAVRVKNFTVQVRGVFKYGFDSELLAVPVRYGPDFAAPSEKTIRRERAQKGPRMFEADEVRKLVNGAKVKTDDGTTLVKPTTALKAMILLGVNCGFGNEDCGTLPRSALDLSAGWVDYPRPKTGNERRCPLWPETVAALKAVLAERHEPRDEADADLVFLTATGRRWAKDTSDAPVSKEMRKLLDALGISGNKNFYALRHTFRTVADETADQPAADLIMGHKPPHISSAYRERISDERLRAVSDHVRKWVFGEEETKGKKRKG